MYVCIYIYIYTYIHVSSIIPKVWKTIKQVWVVFSSHLVDRYACERLSIQSGQWKKYRKRPRT